MKVIIRASQQTSNPYLILLSRALEAEGVTIKFGDAKRFVLWQSVLDHGKPDIMHLQWQHNFFRAPRFWHALIRTIMFFIQFLTLRISGVKFVWTVHNIVNHEKHLARWELKMNRILARISNGVIVHSPAAAKAVAEAYNIDIRRISVVPHGHYADWYPAPISKKQARKALKLAADKKVLLFFGQIRRYKGVDQLIESFKNLPGDDLQLIIAGKPAPATLAEDLKKQAAKDDRVNTRFEFIPDEELITYISACDLAVLPYRDSLTSGAAVLAASCNRPSLMPQLGCMSEFPENASIFYDPEEKDGLVKALTASRSLPLEKMGAAAGAYISQYPWSLVGKKTIAVYTKALDKKRAYKLSHQS